jgi:DNA-binding NarL/FixJ family response regulator
MGESTADDWQRLAQRLQDHGDVPERRAEVVALVAAGRTHAEVADELGLEHRSNVAQHVKRYRMQDRAAAVWLAEHGPEI